MLFMLVGGGALNWIAEAKLPPRTAAHEMRLLVFRKKGEWP